MAPWSARVDWTDPNLTEPQLLAVHDALTGVHGSVGQRPEPGRYGAQISVDAATLRQAVTAAMTAVEQAVRGTGGRFTPVQVDVLDEATFHARFEEPTIPELVGTREAAGILRVSQQRVSQLAREHDDFPPPVAQLAAGPVYVADHIRAFDRRWTRQRTGRPKKTSAAPA